MKKYIPLLFLAFTGCYEPAPAPIVQPETKQMISTKEIKVTLVRYESPNSVICKDENGEEYRITTSKPIHQREFIITRVFIQSDRNTEIIYLVK